MIITSEIQQIKHLETGGWRAVDETNGTTLAYTPWKNNAEIAEQQHTIIYVKLLLRL